MIWGVHSENGDFVNHDYPKLTVMSALGQKSFRHICIDLSNSNIHIKYKKSTSIDISPLKPEETTKYRSIFEKSSSRGWLVNNNQ